MNPSAATLKDELIRTLKTNYGYAPDEATDRQMYGAVLTGVQSYLTHKRADYLDALQ